MFTQIKMFITLLMVVGLAGAGVYVMKLRTDNEVLKANQVQLEQGLQEQKKLLEQQEKDFNAIMESNKKLNKLWSKRQKSYEKERNKKYNRIYVEKLWIYIC